MKHSTIPERSSVAQENRWDLSSLFADDAAWNAALAEFATAADRVNAFREALTTTVATTDALADCLAVYAEAGELAERLGNYAFLQKSVDESDSINQDRLGRYMMAASSFEAQTSWLVPAIQALPGPVLAPCLDPNSTNPLHLSVRNWLEKLLRLKPYILGDREERILALQMEARQGPKTAFSALTNVDIDFGTVRVDGQDLPLTQTTWSSFLENPDRSVREAAYKQFYAAFEAHRHSITALYTASVNDDIAEARIRGYPSARAMALFPDKVDEAVYDNLVSTVRANLAPLHRYYALRKRVLGVQELRHWDVYVPLVREVRQHTPYNKAVSLIGEALSPLGSEYVDTLTNGLLNGWVDRYENRGKRSGAFSSGGFTGYPYILMNYKDEVLRDVYTLAHEAGHSMHSWYSARSNPFLSYSYTIFEAEVASTFNEDLLFRHLKKQGDEPALQAYLLSNRASDILATLYRQTMFAEFEKRTHELVEGGTPLTVDLLRAEYRSLLQAYFGPEMVFEGNSDMEGLRIPHFYNAFYVYKYATGISASLALAERVCSGGKKEREDYFAFLKSGGSRYPIEALQVAGVDMQSPEPVEAACRTFAGIVDELERIL